MTAITLTRNQAEKVAEIVTHFHEVNFFTIAINCDSEIGEGMSISFQLFNDAEEDDTSINITDPSIW